MAGMTSTGTGLDGTDVKQLYYVRTWSSSMTHQTTDSQWQELGVAV